jgi:hypothetical protein
MEESDHGLTESIRLAFAWRDWEKPQSLSQNSRFWGRHLNSRCVEYKEEMPTTPRKIRLDK